MANVDSEVLYLIFQKIIIPFSFQSIKLNNVERRRGKIFDEGQHQVCKPLYRNTHTLPSFIISRSQLLAFSVAVWSASAGCPAPSCSQQQALFSHIPRGHMRLESHLLTLCPCNNIHCFCYWTN